MIEYWIKEERLDFSKDSPVSFVCEKCGMPIRTGRFCKKCKSELQRELQKMLNSNVYLIFIMIYIILS